MSTASPVPDETLDALGLLCPLPVLRARKRLSAMAPGSVLKVEADDPAALIDVPHFCQEVGHVLLESESTGARHVFWIRKAG